MHGGRRNGFQVRGPGPGKWRAFEALERQAGPPDVVIYNASARARGPLATLNPDDVQHADGPCVWRVPRRATCCAQDAEQGLRSDSVDWSVGQCEGLCRIGAVCDGEVRAARVGPKHGARALAEGHSCRAFCSALKVR